MALKLIVTAPFQCPFHSNEEHMHDDDFEVHSYPDSAIKAPGHNKYVAWEYEHIGKALPLPFKRCQQQLIQDDEQKPIFSLDRLVVRDIKGEHHVFYFDVTEPLAKERGIYQQAWEDHLNGKKIDPGIAKDFERAAEVKTQGSRIIRLKPTDFGKSRLPDPGREGGGK